MVVSTGCLPLAPDDLKLAGVTTALPLQPCIVVGAMVRRRTSLPGTEPYAAAGSATLSRVISRSCTIRNAGWSMTLVRSRPRRRRPREALAVAGAWSRKTGASTLAAGGPVEQSQSRWSRPDQRPPDGGTGNALPPGRVTGGGRYLSMGAFTRLPHSVQEPS